MNINAGVNERINTCLVPFLYEKRSFKLPRQAQDKHLQGGLLLRNRGGVLFLQGERGGRPGQHTAAEHF